MNPLPFPTPFSQHEKFAILLGVLQNTQRLFPRTFSSADLAIESDDSVTVTELAELASWL